MEEMNATTDLKILITECTAYDYKVELEERKPKSWLKSVSAFANTRGGSLFFGVDNDGLIKGIDNIQHVCEIISMDIRDRMDPLPDVELIPLEMEDMNILQLKVYEGRYSPYYYVGDGQRIAFVRNGEESLPATAEEMVRLVLKGSNKTYDSLCTDYKTVDYSFAMLANTFKERTAQDWDKKYLLSFGLVTQEGFLTNAGLLFADDCNLSQSRLYCTRWNGLEKDDALNDAEFKGNILLLLREAMNFVKSNTRKGWEKLPNRRKNKPEYAERAVLETLVNHFIHRDYTVMGGEVHLDIYDDRIAVTSPGGMYNGLRVQDIPIEEVSSERRNPVLADVMAQLDYMEKRGSGLKRICNETQNLESYKEERKPVFKSSASQFMTTIYSMEYEAEASDVPSSVPSSVPSMSEVCTMLEICMEKAELLIGLVRQPASATELMQALEQTNRTRFKKRYLDPLLAMGVIEMTQPDSPKSPTQRYRLTEKGQKLLE